MRPGPSRTLATLGVTAAILAAVSGLVYLAVLAPGVFVLGFLAASFAASSYLTRPQARPRPPRRPLPRLAIRHLMVAVALFAVPAVWTRWIISAARERARGQGLPEPELTPGIAAVFALICLFTAVLGYLARLVIVPILALVKGPPRRDPMFGLSKKERRAKVLEAPFPAGWSAILEENVPLAGRLPEADRLQLRQLIQCFLAEKVFEGCAGLEITDEIRVTIAAQACLLLLRRETDIYPKLITVLVYPSAYVSETPRRSPRGLVTEGPQGRLGEAWTSGVVVLSWDDVRRGAADVRDGRNVAIHEFAHQLDQEDGAADGTPVLPGRSLYTAWSRILGAEYQGLRQSAEKGKKSVLDEYGATDPAEFFAVATEAFFEKPAPLRKKHPELYDELKTYYAQDPEAEDSADSKERSGPRPKL